MTRRRRGSRSRPARIAVGRIGLFLTATILAACSSAARSERPTRTLTVFAAASLAGPFSEMGKRLEAEKPGLAVRFNFAGSPGLAGQIAQGAHADVFAAADEHGMRYAETVWHQDAGVVQDGSKLAAEPRVFARNRLVVVIPRSNPARIGRLQDLGRRGVRLVLGGATVPIGRYSAQVLGNLSQQPGFDADYVQRVYANCVSQEENVKAIVTKVQLGEVDAGIVYRSDVTPAVARFVRVLVIPEAANVVATYPIAILRDARLPDDARAFVDLVLSPRGQEILMRHGFLPAHPG